MEGWKNIYIYILYRDIAIQNTTVLMYMPLVTLLCLILVLSLMGCSYFIIWDSVMY